MLAALGPLLSAGASILGGMMGNEATADANKLAAAQAAAANKTQLAIAQKNIAMQQLFAHKGIQWKVKDAARAGIHPLYALGANTASYSPVSVTSSTYSPAPEVGMANALGSVGQDISRAVTAVLTPQERMFQDASRALELQRMGLTNELLKSQIARERQVTMPGVPENLSLYSPDIPRGVAKPMPPLQFRGFNWLTDRSTSSGTAVQDRYGDEGPIAWFAGVPALLSDLWQNSLLGRYSVGAYPFNK